VGKKTRTELAEPLESDKKRYVIKEGIGFSDNIDIDKMVKKLFSEIGEIARAQGKENIDYDVWFFSNIEEKLIVDSNFIRSEKIPRTFIQVIFKTKREEKRATTRFRLGNPMGLEMLFKDKKNFELSNRLKEGIAKWARYAFELLDAKTLSSNEIEDVDYFILDYSAIGVFIHEALGHNFEADIIKGGSSGIIPASGRMNTRIGSKCVNIYDGPIVENGSLNMHEGFGTEFIDDEGTPVQLKKLAIKGKVNEMILNRETAAYYGLKPNGGAWSEMGDEPICRMTNTYLYPADESKWFMTLKGLLKGVKKGIILMGTKGGQVSKDGMTSSIQIGYLVKNGEIVCPLNPGSFSAISKYALRYVDAFAGKIRIDDAGFCGKGGQTRPVGDGGPEWTRIKNNKYVTLRLQG